MQHVCKICRLPCLNLSANEPPSTQLQVIAIEMKNTLSQLHGHILSQQATPRGIGTQWRQEPMTLEDALGFLVPIPLELVNSWDVGGLFFSIDVLKTFEACGECITLLYQLGKHPTLNSYNFCF